jgi:L-xylulokinase
MAILTIDCGLSAVKAAAFTTSGEILANAECPNDALRVNGASSRMDMDRLFELAAGRIREVLDLLDNPSCIQAISLTGHGNGAYIVDKDGAGALAVSSMDTTAADLVTRWIRDGVAAEISRNVGGYVWAGQPLPILSLLRDELPGEYTVLFCKDWVRYRLTGFLATDRGEASAAGLLDAATGAWAFDVFDSVGIANAPAMVPELLENPQSHAGRISAEGSKLTGIETGVPVFAGSIDLAVGAYGDRLDNRDTLHVTAGTWSIIQKRTIRNKKPAEFLQIIDSPWIGEKLLVESSPTCAANFAVVARFLRGDTDKPGNLSGNPGEGNIDFKHWERLVAESADDEVPLYLPYPTGAWDMPEVRAFFVGDSSDYADRQIVRAVYEGIVCGIVRQIGKFFAAGENPGSILLTGGLIRSSTWVQMLCDATQLPVEVADDPHAGLRGCMMCAAEGLGIEHTDCGIHRDRYLPDVSMKTKWAEKFDRFMLAIERSREDFGRSEG